MSIIGPFDPKLLGNLGAEAAVARFRELLLCEARYVGLRPDAVTISANLYVSDGGIDAQVESNCPLPEDSFIRYGRTGFQLKTGTTFKPWQQSTLKSELLSHANELTSEVRRTLEAGGHYFLVCFGLDLTPEQRNDSKEQIAALFADFGFLGMGAHIEVFGQSQISAYVERYPSLRLAITGGSNEDFLSVSEWSKHAHMSNELVLSEDQAKLVEQIREKLRGDAMPESLHGWFMDMFRYAHDSNAAQIVRNILRRDGVFSDRNFLCSAKGASFLSTLAEADPDATLDLIEHTIGSWSREELIAFKTDRQSIVWTLEKIAVWRPTVVRAIRMLTQLALTENASNSNNSTGTLLGLFRIGCEAAATEASPEERLPALLEMLRSDDDDFKRMGLKVAEAALTTSGMGFRIVGAEYQGIKERAELWAPKTYGEWWAEYHRYWDCLISETRNWGDDLRREANSAILVAAKEQLQIAPHTEKVLSIVEQVSADPSTDRRRLNHFFIRLLRRNREENDQLIRFRLRRLAGSLARQNLESRFQRYVLDTTWEEWEDYEIDAELRERTRPKRLLIGLAERVAKSDEAFERLLPKLVTKETETAALYAFGEAMAAVDVDNQRLPSLLLFESISIKSQCLGGYLAGLKARDQNKWREVLLGLLANQDTANFGADLARRSGFDNQVLSACLDTFEAGWVEPGYFQSLCYGKSWQAISQDVLVRLLTLLSNREDQISAYVLVDLLDQVLTMEDWPVDSDFVFRVVTAPSHFEERLDTMHAYHWHRVCEKLVAYDPTKAMPLLDVLLQQMGSNYRLSYDHDVAPFAQALCHNNPAEAWKIVAVHLLSVAPKWRGELINWLKGGIGGFGEKNLVPPIAEFPLQTVLDWIAQNPEGRAAMIAHCAPNSLNDEFGGALTRALLVSYQDVDGVPSGISTNFGSGGWSGPRSQHLRTKRDRFRGWLSKGFDRNVVTWIESEITYLDQDIEAAEISEERESWNRPSNN